MPTSISQAKVAQALGPWALADASRPGAVARCHRPDAIPTVRLNRLGPPGATPALPFTRRPVPWAADRAFFIEPHARPGGHLLYGAGAYYIQDASSLLAVSLLDPEPGEIICDLCASPGGKSTDILEAMGPRGFLLVNEAIRSRLGPLRLNLARNGAWRYALSNLDPEKLADRLGPAFDAVLVDAPCSGQSMVVRGKQALSAFDRRAIRLNTRRQQRILRAAVRLLRPGGRLIYSTCTYSWSENEEHVVGLLESVPREWHSDPRPGLDPFAAGHPAPAACYRLWPDRHGCAGAFAARLRYQPTQPPRNPHGPPGPRKTKLRRLDHRSIPFDAWGSWGERPLLVGDQRNCHVMAGNAPAWAAQVGTPPPVALKKGRSWFPAYALAMRRDGAFRPARCLPLSLDQAAAYLAGRPGSTSQDGWCLCTFEGLALGWGKGSNGALKNHLPPPARLQVSAG